jgi:hypothetical protein
MALACALDYRDAISLLRRVLGSQKTVSNLGKSFYADYTKRLPMLIYEFSMLGEVFADRWLDMSDYEITLTSHSSDSTSRQLDISWCALRFAESMATAVTVQIEGESSPRLNLKSFGDSTSTTIDIPPFSASKGLKITVEVTAIAVAMGGDPKYAFLSQGKPSAAVIEEVLPSTTTLDFKEDFSRFRMMPEGLDSAVRPVGEKMKVFLLGSYRYWRKCYPSAINYIYLWLYVFH